MLRNIFSPYDAGGFAKNENPFYDSFDFLLQRKLARLKSRICSSETSFENNPKQEGIREGKFGFKTLGFGTYSVGQQNLSGFVNVANSNGQ